MLQHLLHGLGRLRHAALAVGVAAFALVQVLSPLLHTHVSTSAAALQSGIHLPVALVHDGHGHGVSTAADDMLLDETDAITAPPEHRRDDRPPLPRAVVLAPGWMMQLARTGAPAPRDAASDSPAPGIPFPHPPSRGPPAIA